MKLALKIFLPLVALAALFLQGCSVQPQNIALDPTVQVPESKLGQGKVVQLVVRDVRPRKTLGTVGDLNGKWAHVSIENDLTAPVYQRVSAGLIQQGFMVQPTPSSDGRKLEVEVRDIEYGSTKEGFTYTTKGTAAIRAIATSGEYRFERDYTAGEKLADSATIPGEKENVQAVNRIVGATLEEMLKDDRLRSVLVR